MRIKEGASYEELASKFPITKNGFKLLGGVLKHKRKVTSNSLAVLYDKKLDPKIGSLDIIVEEEKDKGSKILNKNFIIGTLLGDASLVKCTDNEYKRTFYYALAHTWRQIAYMKLNYERIKAYVNSIRLHEPRENSGLQDYVIYLATESSEDFSEYYDLFYTEDTGEKTLKKNVLKKEIAEQVEPEALAYWLMDDGSNRGYGNGVFRISIGAQKYYDEASANIFVEALSKKLDIPLYFSIDSYSITIFNRKESSDKVVAMIAPYLIPDMGYKLNLAPFECGEVYSQLNWYKKWEREKTFLEHPFLEKYTLRDYRESADTVFKERFLRALLYRTQVRGFPYPRYSEDDLLRLWGLLVNSQYGEEGKYLRYNANLNSFPSYFMPHRYHCTKDGSKSVYDTFLDKDTLKKAIELQLKSNGNIDNSNIRNAVASYGTSAPSQFNPAYARFLINEFSKEGDTVLDPCSGWGSRLVSAISLNRKYYGIEPSTKTVEGLESIREWFLRNNIPHSIKIVKGCAEDPVSYGGELFDLAFTSPPFFNKEHYSDEETQSDVRYRTFEEWCESFLRIMVRNVYDSLKPGGIFILNANNYKDCPLAYIVKLISKSEGFLIKDIYYTYKNTRPMIGKSNNEEFIVMEKKHG